MRWFRFQCYKENYSKVQKCSCTKYKVYHTVYVNDTVPNQVTYLSGTFTKEDNPDHTHGLLAPLYVDREKDLMLFSHHPEGLVWQVSQKLTTTPLRGVFNGPSCPDSEQITWEWYNVTTSQVTYLILPKTNQTQINCELYVFQIRWYELSRIVIFHIFRANRCMWKTPIFMWNAFLINLVPKKFIENCVK